MEPTVIVVLALSLGLALANSVFFIVGGALTPPGTVFLGTIHYWEDYFFYLNHFFQGAHGQWLTINTFTSERTASSIIYWINILFGKLGGILRLTPILMYNVTTIILSFIVLVLSFIVIRTLFFPQSPMRALLAFIFANLSTSLINRVHTQDGTMIFWPFQIWKTPHFVFDRLGGVPHQIAQTIFFYLLLLMVFNKKIGTSRLRRTAALLLESALAIALTSINPFQAVLWAGVLFTTICITSLANHTAMGRLMDLKKVIIVIACMAVAFVYMSNVLNTPPHIQSKLWEAQQQSYTTWSFLFLSIGPVLVLLAILGVVSRAKKLQLIDWFGIVLIGFGYVLFMSPLPKLLGFSNVRILFPASYVFWGAFAVYGADWLSSTLSKRLRLKQAWIMSVVVFVFLLSTLPTLLWELSVKMPMSSMMSDPLVYLPLDIYNGFSYLASMAPYGDIVIANPTYHFDTLIPALSGHTTYSGNMIQTMYNDSHQQEVHRLFALTMSSDSARAWLVQKNIRYILFVRTTDGDDRVFETRYSFLKRYFSNNAVNIYAVY